MTVFDPSRQECYQFGNTDERTRRLRPLLAKIDQWNERNRAQLPKTTEKEKECWSRRAKKLWYRLNNQVKSIHAEVIAHLVNSYNFISLGKLDVSSFRSGDTQKSTNRWLRLYRHFDFRTKLLARIEGEGRHIRVEITDERYTSKTCGVCKKLHDRLGASETFHCPHCNFSCHRDVNGARNILLRALGLF